MVFYTRIVFSVLIVLCCWFFLPQGCVLGACASEGLSGEKALVPVSLVSDHGTEIHRRVCDFFMGGLGYSYSSSRSIWGDYAAGPSGFWIGGGTSILPRIYLKYFEIDTGDGSAAVEPPYTFKYLDPSGDFVYAPEFSIRYSYQGDLFIGAYLSSCTHSFSVDLPSEMQHLYPEDPTLTVKNFRYVGAFIGATWRKVLTLEAGYNFAIFETNETMKDMFSISTEKVNGFAVRAGFRPRVSRFEPYIEYFYHVFMLDDVPRLGGVPSEHHKYFILQGIRLGLEFGLYVPEGFFRPKPAKKLGIHAEPSKSDEQGKMSGVSAVDAVPKNSRTNNENAVCVIFGVGTYRNIPRAEFADRDAYAFCGYAEKMLGIPSDNIYKRINHDATKAEFEWVFKKEGWIQRRIVQGETDVFIYFGGHGFLPAGYDQPVILPADIVSGDYTNGVPLGEVCRNLSNMKARSVTVFLDACFCGVDRSEKSFTLYRPPLILREGLLEYPGITVITACTHTQYSKSYEDAGHGLFTYFLLKGMGGDADLNGDRNLTLDELYDYTKREVEGKALELNHQQTPTVKWGGEGEKKRVIIKYRVHPRTGRR